MPKSIMFSSWNFNEINGCYGPPQEYVTGKQAPPFGLDVLSSTYGNFPDNTAEEIVEFSQDQQQTISDDFHQMGVPLSAAQTQIQQLGEEKPFPLTLESLDILKNFYRNQAMASRDLAEGNSDRKLSTEEIMRVAGERFIEYSSRWSNGFTMFIHPYGPSSLSGLSMEETRDVELSHLLLVAAEKVGFQQFDIAEKLLSRCLWVASDKGNAVHRIVFYFTEALKERICRQTGRRIPKQTHHDHRKGLGLGTNLAFLAFHLDLPLNQVTQFAGTQAILENLTNATNIHVIDLQIRSGVQWTALMQALAIRQHLPPIELLKITAVGTTDEHKIKSTGKWLQSFAKTLNLPFSFIIVFLSDMKDLTEEMLEVKPGETVTVYAATVLRTMIPTPDSLEHLMRVIRRVNPSIMVVVEVEADHNSPSFVKRFIEALFFYSAFFDCLEDCMGRDNQYRMELEGIHFWNGIRNTVAEEGEERFNRNVKINVWRAFFARFGMAETELSESALYQASLVLGQFQCGSSCTLDHDDKCLIIGWKGTPLHSLSTWKFL